MNPANEINAKLTESLFLKNLYPLLQLEIALLLLALVACAWLFYRFFLKELSEARHRSLRNSYQKILRLMALFAVFFSVYFFLTIADGNDLNWIDRLRPYFALLAYFAGLFLLVRACRMLLLQYLFLSSMKAGVPILLVNIFSLALSLALIVWTASHVFGIQLGPLLATSAVFSIILGLALQDTLGNIFSGISLQIDKAFEIDDWLEIMNGPQKVVGQVKEITWRSTVLVGWSDELIILPNRTVANSQISNFTDGRIPIIRSQGFRIAYGEDLEKVRTLLLESLQTVSAIRGFPRPLCFISEMTESWVYFKLAYYLDSYGLQYSVGDKVIRSALQLLHENGIEVTADRLALIKQD